MREIKFRVWRNKTKEMIYENIDNILHHFSSEAEVSKSCTEPNPDLECNEYKFADAFGYKDSVIMQFTGLKDKNGKEIYEGDIIRLRGYGVNDSRKIQDIIFHEGKFQSHLENDLIGCEVIGNIYENPELIKS